jgi:hypothetical protein
MKKLLIGLFLVSIVFLMLPDVGADNLANNNATVLISTRANTVKMDSTTNTVKSRDLPYNTTSQLNRLVTSTASTVVALTGRTLIEIMPCSTTTDIVVSVGVATATVTGSSGRPVTMAAPFREFLDDDVVVWVIATASQYICVTQTSY